MGARKYWWIEAHAGHDGVGHDARVVKCERHGAMDMDYFAIEEKLSYMEEDGRYSDRKELHYEVYQGWACAAKFNVNKPFFLPASNYEEYKNILWRVMIRFGCNISGFLEEEVPYEPFDWSSPGVRVDFNEGDKVMIEEDNGSFYICMENPVSHDFSGVVVKIPNVPVGQKGWEDDYALKKDSALWIRNELMRRYDDIGKLFIKGLEEWRRLNEKETKK